MLKNICHPQPDDVPGLRHIWKTVFKNPLFDETEEFFKEFFDPKMTIAAVSDNAPQLAAAGYLLPAGNLLPSGTNRCPCAMIYAVAVLPEFRGLGYGAAVTRELISTGYKSGFDAIILRPAQESLFNYYEKHTEFREWFCIHSQMLEITPASDKAASSLTSVNPEEYQNLREALLEPIPHVELSLQMLKYQKIISRLSGGGLFRIDTPGGISCAVTERESDGTVAIKELLTPEGCRQDALGAVAAAYPAKKYNVRLPAQTGEKERFGMLASHTVKIDTAQTPGRAPWYGPAFD